MDAFTEKHAAFVAAKAAFLMGTASYADARAAHREMCAADDYTRYMGSDYEGRGHWAPSTWDKRLPAPLRKVARDIGRNLRRRLEDEWSEAHKCLVLYGNDDTDGWDPYYTAKEQHRVLVCKYMGTLSNDDPDVVAYNRIHSAEALEPYTMPQTEEGEAAALGLGAQAADTTATAAEAADAADAADA